jgi:serine-type D-Ala-D-Ala carboxypeptidase/endopeptidase (penicillin-binding protein 4)
MRRLLALVCAFFALALTPAAQAQGRDAALKRSLTSAARSAGSASGVFVLNATDRDVLFRKRERTRRILASNTKLFTTGAALAQIGVQGTIATDVLGDGTRDPTGVFRGDLYLRGGGDPTFGSVSFVKRRYGGDGATVEQLADQLAASGLTEVRGAVVGDESRFDSLRGGPASDFRVSRDVSGILSGLAFNRGLANEFGGAFQTDPPAFAADRLDDALEERGIRVTRSPRAGTTPPGATPLATVSSPPMRRIAQLTNKDSDNFFAEMLVKAVELSKNGRGATAPGARTVARFARELDARPRLVDGSGLSRGNTASPKDIVNFLDELRVRDEFPAFFDSLTIAGVDGTLRKRMRRGPARRRCRGKTGTLIGVSALSGYCQSLGGDTIVFSILINRAGFSAKKIEDRMVQAIARFRG